MLDRNELIEILAAERVKLRQVIHEEVVIESRKLESKIDAIRNELVTRLDRVELRLTVVEKEIQNLKRNQAKTTKEVKTLTELFSQTDKALLERIKKIEYTLAIA